MDCLQLSIPPIPQFMTVGHSVWKPGDCHFERTFQVYDMLIVTRGTMYMAEDGEPYAIEAGGMLVLEAGRTHAGYRACEEDTEIYWLHFVHRGPALRVKADHIPWSSIRSRNTDMDTEPAEHYMFIPKFASGLDLAPLIPTLQAMLDLHRSLQLFGALQLHSYLARLFTQLQSIVAAEQQPSKSLQISREAEKFLRRSMEQPFSSGALEAALSYHFDYITRCLKKHTGMSPMKYLQYMRIEEAKKLLVQTRDSVPVIAGKVGIPDYNYFIRVFRRQAGQAPGAYRRERQGFV
ncbi:helix-turn-helix domain-containing protein [Paenibacillus nasutitermitis]|uniref:HTH-type transcriptional regulator YisR n=1 Tax=Paenibacillus nasutitermitis TaxID=1652958 RepID=A0A917E0F6_9BACL|nr:AraC family transcriptional regulator [Paenibacillus nasutitermitis]GGD84313.1 putative HTH-type transcriptional regulator YisR [Paenibacillus nasutitermitis]